jgi:AcrR family transcriptional regulator
LIALSPRTRAVATLGRIVDATRTLLANRDYASLSVRAVATEAGVSPAAIYRHFSNKRHLVDYVCHASLEEFHTSMTAAVAAHPPGSFDRVIAQGIAYIRLALDKPEHYKILFTPVKSQATKLTDLPHEGGFRLLRQSVREAMDAGKIRSGDAGLVAFFLWSRVHGIVALLMACDFSDSLDLPEKDITPLRLFEMTRVLLWEGLKPEADTTAS